MFCKISVLDEYYINQYQTKAMELLLITGVSANDIFICNMAKWLRKSMNVEIDVLSLNAHDDQTTDMSFFRNITYINEDYSGLKRRVLGWTQAFRFSRRISSYLTDKHYDIIHCHWLVPSIVLTFDLKCYCKKLFVTFWGGEFNNMTILRTKMLYLIAIKKFFKNVDGIINSKESYLSLQKYLPHYKGIFYEGAFGSEPLEQLYKLMESESKKESKTLLGIRPNSFTILIGYSGKKLHRHLKVLEAISKCPDILDSITILAPMTRNFDSQYVKEVEERIKKMGCDYWLKTGYLTDSDIARLRNATDIVMQYSDFDGFSRSIVECLCAKSFMVYGDWIDYDKHLKRLNFFAKQTISAEEGVSVIKSYIYNPKLYEDLLYSNWKNGKGSYFWSECIKDWINAYLDNTIC